ncbi:uncharacterized protein LOC122507221 [Leptopilina heterotoma]|uniref:uncharacterized protein LOC122507221 n=1 Tax=Leptopilina heterotoma TaxID=63436 RepID=UPI001CA8EA69|nr:uncharacterized protein LOC122507221 [Leptopilina heterotoma]
MGIWFDIVWGVESKRKEGDWNARTGEELGGCEWDRLDPYRGYTRDRKSKDKVLNAEGKKLLEICEEQGLRILNGRIEGDTEGNWTCICGEGGSVLDYIIVMENSDECPVKKLEVEPRIESDHFPICFNLELEGKLVTVDQKDRVRKQRRNILKWEKEKEEEYRREMENLWDEGEKSEIWEDRWNNFKQSIWKAAELVGLIRKESNGNFTVKTGFDKDCVEQRSKGLLNGNNENINETTRENATGNNNSENREVGSSIETDNDEDDNDLNADISFDELAKCIMRMKKGTAPGEDGVPIEFIIGIPRVWALELHKIINGFWNQGKLGKGWEKARIIAIYKDGDENDTNNYRGISLLDTGYKILASLLDERIRNWEKGKLHAAFIDFKKAFDTVDREILFRKLSNLGIKGKMLKMIMEIYRVTSNEVVTEEGLTDSFETNRGVRQGCPLSPTLFNIFIEDMDEIWEIKKEGGTVIGKVKIYSLKFADDLVLLADFPEGLRQMLKSLEGYVTKNGLEVNIKKSKVIVFRKGGKLKKGEKWEIFGEKLEIVNEYKYLGFWFSTKGSHGRHVKKMAGKMQKATNAAWGVLTRARIGGLNTRLYIMDILSKSGGLYGVEIWGWEKWDTMEKAQGRFVKMAMGLDINTPDYIWKMESGRVSLDVEAKRRVFKYLKEILNMEENRLPRICLNEELRGIKNNFPSAWGAKVQKVLSEVGDGRTIQLLGPEENMREISENIKRNIKVKMDQDIQQQWYKIDKSSYCKNYGKWKSKIGRENYWEIKELSFKDKEQWARIRCGNVGRAGNKGFTDVSCRLCGSETENIEHIWVCKKARELIDKKWVEEVDKWTDCGKNLSLQKIWSTMSGKPILALCRYARAFEDLSKCKQSGL